MKSICILLKSTLSTYPPLLSLLENLHDYSVTVISGNNVSSIVQRYPQYNFIEIGGKRNTKYSKIIQILKFRKRCKQELLNNSYDIIWCATADTAICLRGIIEKYNYVLNIFELYDRLPFFRKLLARPAQKAKAIIVPEINRANIFRVWFNLSKTPYVIPNKFLDKPSKRDLDITRINSPIDGIKEKIILYQGIASPERDLRPLCESIKELSNYKLVIMSSETPYLRSLLKAYPFIIHQPFIIPPEHLKITSHAYIGVVTYNFYSLNTIFCAPNKIWEYSSFAIPMLCNDIPGLRNTVGTYNAGICTNMLSKDDIKKAILKIDLNYSIYSCGAESLFNSVSVSTCYEQILNSL